MLLIFVFACSFVSAQTDTSGKAFCNSTHTQLYPFSTAKIVKIVSYSWRQDSVPGMLRTFTNHKIPLINGVVNEAQLDQLATLSAGQIDSLSDILFNTCRKLDSFISSSHGCYLPRNAIIFIDTAGHPFEYIELCFECHNFRKSNIKIQNPVSCDLMYDELQAFFEKMGLKTSAMELMTKPLH